MYTQQPGNLLRTTDGRLCILDWGMTLEVPNDLQYALLEFIAHINSEGTWSSVFFSLNILAFLTHTAQHLLNKAYRLLRETLVVRCTFFNDLKSLTRYIIFDSWDALFAFMIDGLELSP